MHPALTLNLATLEDAMAVIIVHVQMDSREVAVWNVNIYINFINAKIYSFKLGKLKKNVSHFIQPSNSDKSFFITQIEIVVSL